MRHSVSPLPKNPSNPIIRYGTPLKQKENQDQFKQSEKHNYHLQQQLLSKIQRLQQIENDFEKKLAIQYEATSQWNKDLQQELESKQTLWKKKHDEYLNQIVTLKANYDLEIKDLSQQVKQLSRRVSKPEFMEGELQQLRELCNMKSRENTVLNNNIKILSDDNKKLTTKIQSQKSDLKHLKQMLNQKHQELDRLLHEKSQLLEEFEKMYKQEDTKTSELKTKFDELEALNGQLMEQLDQLKRLQNSSYKTNHPQPVVKFSITTQTQQNSKITYGVSTQTDYVQQKLKYFQDYSVQTDFNEEPSVNLQSIPNTSGEMLIKIQLLIKKVEQQQDFIKQLQSQLDSKTIECEEHFRARTASERNCNQVTEEYERCKQKLEAFEREKIVDQEELQMRLFYNHQNQVQSLKSEYEHKILKLNDELVDLKRSHSLTASGVFTSLPRRSSKSSEKLL